MSTRQTRSAVVVLVSVSLVVVALIAGGVTGQTGTQQADGDTPDQDDAFLRVAHVSPDAPAVDVYADGEQVLSDVEFGNATEYLTLSAGEVDVRVTPAGDNETTVFEGNVTLEPRTAVTLFAAGEVSDDAEEPFDPVVFEDDAVRPADNESAVSVAHMSPDAPEVDVTADGGDVVLAENLTYANASQYVTVPAGEHSVEIRQSTADADGPVVVSTNFSLEGGTAYSALAIGYVDSFHSTVHEEFRIESVEDATKTIHLPSDEVETETPEPETEETETEEVETEVVETETEAVETDTETESPETETEEVDTETETETEAPETTTEEAETEEADTEETETETETETEVAETETEETGTVESTPIV